ncbi:MAG: hypothetical protein J2P49_05865 [Methylocapsa sp.]|nr:hypothetical protein [Methylocapsa sp.]
MTKKELDDVTRRTSFAYLAALAIIGAGTLFSVAASAEEKAKPKAGTQEKAKPQPAKPDAMKPKEDDSGAMKSDDMKSDDSESDQMGDDLGNQD